MRSEISKSIPLLALNVLLAFGCESPTAGPTPTAPPAEPEPVAVSVEIDPTAARVGEVVTFTYRLSARLEFPLDIWTEVTPPSGDRYEGGPLRFAIGDTALLFSTGYLREIDVGDWGMRIKGERLPDGVVLGEPSFGAWSVVP